MIPLHEKADFIALKCKSIVKASHFIPIPYNSLYKIITKKYLKSNYMYEVMVAYDEVVNEKSKWRKFICSLFNNRFKYDVALKLHELGIKKNIAMTFNKNIDITDTTKIMALAQQEQLKLIKKRHNKYMLKYRKRRKL